MIPSHPDSQAEELRRLGVRKVLQIALENIHRQGGQTASDRRVLVVFFFWFQALRENNKGGVLFLILVSAVIIVITISVFVGEGSSDHLAEKK